MNEIYEAISSELCNEFLSISKMYLGQSTTQLDKQQKW